MSKECRHSLEKVINELGTYQICKLCGKTFVSKRRKLANLWIAQRFYQSRGSTYTGQVRSLLNAVTTGGIIFLLIKAVWDEIPPLWILPCLWLTQAIVETYMGIIDFKKWKIAQYEGLFGFQFSPFSIENLRRIKNIEKVVNPTDYREESIVDSINGGSN